jgi:hypothetical protein
MWFGILTLLTALILSVSAAVYSILGLTAIFAAAFWPIVILGGSLEFGKIVTTLWLHKYWKQAQLQYKIYLCSAVAILMLLTSMGVFGFLSKAHLDQEVPAGDIQAQVQIFDDKIQTQQDNIKTARAALAQMDSQVDQLLGRSSDERGAERAVQIRRNQARERTALQNDISKAQAEITRLQEQRAPVASQARVLAAEVGPIKYIAALVYGDNPEANVLEKAVRWVIILIVVVFDPLAITLLLAATKTFEWERANKLASARKEPDYEADDGPLTQDQIDQLKATAKADLPTGETVFKDTLFPDEQEFFDRAKQTAQAIDAGTYEPPVEPDPYQDIKAPPADWYDHVDEEPPTVTLTPPDDTTRKPAVAGPRAIYLAQELAHQADKLAQKLAVEADNLPGTPGTVTGFGTSFPHLAERGDMFIRTDQLPSVLFKFNGQNWIQADKGSSTSYVYDDAYIDYLISQLANGEYDADLLSEAERDRIEQRLNNPRNV